MPKISALPPMTTAADDDEAPIVDTSVTTTKKWTLTLLKTYLQSLVAWITHTMVADGFVVQRAATDYTAVATGTTNMGFDDTIPQIGEGNEFMTITITPKSATNILVIEGTAMLANSGVQRLTGALFQDAVANAIWASAFTANNIDAPDTFAFCHKRVAGSTSAMTFRLRVGREASGTVSFNGNAGARLYGAIPKSTIRVTEYKAS